MIRSEAVKDYSSKIFSFSFKSKRPIKWLGYRDDDPSTPPNQIIEGNIWMAGSDPKFIVLGVDFSRPDMGLMNTLHLALPAERNWTKIEDGLVIETYPIDKNSVSNQSSEPTPSSVTPPARQAPRHP